MSHALADYRYVHSRPFQDGSECVSGDIGSQVSFQSSHSAYFSKTWIHFANDLVDSVLPLHFRSVYLPVQYREYVILVGSIRFGVFPDYLLADIA